MLAVDAQHASQRGGYAATGSDYLLRLHLLLTRGAQQLIHQLQVIQPG